MYLAIDLGNKRCGIALYLEQVVIPKDIVQRVKLVPYLKKQIKDYNIKTIVVGLPYDLYGRDTKQLDKTKSFISKLKTIFPEQEIVGEDERYTSFEADNILDNMGIKEKQGKKDDLSAVLILESYLRRYKKI